MDQFVTIILAIVGIIIGAFAYILKREIYKIDAMDKRIQVISADLQSLLQDHLRDHEELLQVKQALIKLSEDAREINTKLNLIYETIQIRIGKNGGSP